MKNPAILAAAIGLGALMTPVPSQAQLFTLAEQLVSLHGAEPVRAIAGRAAEGARRADRAGPRALVRGILTVLPGKGFRNQYEDGFQILHPGTKLVGRAFTVQFMPVRPDVEGVVNAKAKAAGHPAPRQPVRDRQLQPGDVLVVDLFGKKEGGHDRR